MKAILMLALICAASSARAGNDFEPQMRAYLANSLSQWIADPIIIDAIKAQNAKTAGYSQAQISALDKTWRAEVGQSDMPTVSAVLNNAASDFLRKQVGASHGVLSEAFLMDERGLNVAVSSPTSDYWQGDEAKFTNSFGKGASAVDIGEVEFDDSTQIYQAQLSTTIVDPESHAPIGAITVGLNIEALQ